MKVMVLGPGCPRCERLHDNVLAAVRASGVACEVEKVSDMARILAFDIVSTPALVIDGQVRATGRVLTPVEIAALLGDGVA